MVCPGEVTLTVHPPMSTTAMLPRDAGARIRRTACASVIRRRRRRTGESSSDASSAADRVRYNASFDRMLRSQSFAIHACDRHHCGGGRRPPDRCGRAEAAARHRRPIDSRSAASTRSPHPIASTRGRRRHRRSCGRRDAQPYDRRDRAAARRSWLADRRRQDSVANAFDRRGSVGRRSCSSTTRRGRSSAPRLDRAHDRRRGRARRRDCRAAGARHGQARRAPAGRRAHRRDDPARRRSYLAQTPQGIPPRGAARLPSRSGDPASTRPTRRRSPSAPAIRFTSSRAIAANVKITTAERSRVAARRGARVRPVTRVGTGYDLHRLVEGRPLILGGVTIPFDAGRARRIRTATSSATPHRRDARRRRRSATSAGTFQTPIRSGRTRRASSCCATRRGSCASSGFEVVNVDVTVILERPKIAAASSAMSSAAGRRARHRSRRGSASRARRTRASTPSDAAKRSPRTRSRC